MYTAADKMGLRIQNDLSRLDEIETVVRQLLVVEKLGKSSVNLGHASRVRNLLGFNSQGLLGSRELGEAGDQLTGLYRMFNVKDDLKTPPPLNGEALRGGVGFLSLISNNKDYRDLVKNVSSDRYRDAGYGSEARSATQGGRWEMVKLLIERVMFSEAAVQGIDRSLQELDKGNSFREAVGVKAGAPTLAGHAASPVEAFFFLRNRVDLKHEELAGNLSQMHPELYDHRNLTIRTAEGYINQLRRACEDATMRH